MPLRFYLGGESIALFQIHNAGLPVFEPLCITIDRYDQTAGRSITKGKARTITKGMMFDNIKNPPCVHYTNRGDFYNITGSM